MKYSGKDFLLQVYDGHDYVSSLSDRSTSFKVGNETVDATSKSDTQWRELTACGTRTVDITCTGVAVSGAVYGLLMQSAFNNISLNVRIVHGPSAEEVAAIQAQVVSLERTGEHNGAELYSIQFANVAAIGDVVMPLSVTFTTTPTSFATPDIVEFSVVVGGGIGPFTYAWDFGDGGTSTAANPSHLYDHVGSFTATVIVTDSLGAAATYSVTIESNGLIVYGIPGSLITVEGPLARLQAGLYRKVSGLIISPAAAGVASRTPMPRAIIGQTTVNL